jgi:hypothetical protein
MLTLTVPAWSAARKITVQELKDLVAQQAKKGDEDTANALKQVELSEELTTHSMNELLASAPGKLTQEQLYVLEARSAVLPPPPADLPATAAPDAAAQKAILDKANDYVTKTYSQLPHLTATRLSARFQDGFEAVHGDGSMKTGTGVNTDPLWEQTNQYTRLVGAKTDQILSWSGMLRVSDTKDKTEWGKNGQIVALNEGPSLVDVMQQANEAGNLNFVRWEAINGHTFAVFTFTVDKRKSNYGVNYCCFPVTDQAGVLSYKSSSTGPNPPTAHGNLQTATDWKPFKTSPVAYHGELFVEPASGVVIRMITMAEFKPTDFIHREDRRVDFGPVAVEDKKLILPVREFLISDVSANGDSYASRYSLRHDLYSASYKYPGTAPPATAQK